MQEAKVAVCIASACSAFVIIAVLLVVPSLYQQINELHDEIMDGMNAFKVL
jgi:predicted PurR-regulated permease PerM